MGITKVVSAKFQVEGFHNWPDAPKEVAFLRDRHRHIFHIEVGMQVTYSNREVEFILLGRNAKKMLTAVFTNTDGIFEFGHNSCEMIAETLGGMIKDVYFVGVSEDGENEATVWMY